jgi:hypothetical protein
MHDPSADGPCQSANDIDGHDQVQFPESSGVVGPRGRAPVNPVGSRPGALHNDGTAADRSRAITGGVEWRRPSIISAR